MFERLSQYNITKVREFYNSILVNWIVLFYACYNDLLSCLKEDMNGLRDSFI